MPNSSFRVDRHNCACKQPHLADRFFAGIEIRRPDYPKPFGPTGIPILRYPYGLLRTVRW